MLVRKSRLRIRLLAIMEANTLSGPAKNLLDFCRISRDLTDGPIIDTSILTFQRMEQGPSGMRPGQNDFVQDASQQGFEVHTIPERFVFDRKVIGSLKSAVERIAPDIIQTHMFKGHFLVRACGAYKNRAWVAFHHGYTTTTRKRALLAHLDRWSLRAPSQVVTVCQAFADQLCARGVRRSSIKVLHNAIEADWLQRGTADQGCADKQVAPFASNRDKLVLAVGRLSKEKGFPHLIAAIRHVLERNRDLPVRLLIVGEGLERRRLQEQIRRENLEQHVRLVGHVNDVRPYYRSADLLVISSLSEGSPNVLFEALAAGVPVVATKVGGITEIVSHRHTALLVPPCDTVALARGIEEALRNPHLAQIMAARGQELIRARYSPLSRTRALISLYERVWLSAYSSPDHPDAVIGDFEMDVANSSTRLMPADKTQAS